MRLAFIVSAAALAVLSSQGSALQERSYQVNWDKQDPACKGTFVHASDASNAQTIWNDKCTAYQSKLIPSFSPDE